MIKELPEEDKIRASNTARYIEQYCKGKVSILVRLISFSRAQYLNLTRSLKGKRPFGRTLALKIEAALGLPAGLLSIPNCTFPNTDLIIPIHYFNALPDKKTVYDEASIVGDLLKLPSELLKIEGTNHLIGIIAVGKAMEQVINDNAIVIFDSSCNVVESGNIYVFRRNEIGRQVGYLMYHKTGIRIKFANQNFESEVVPFDDPNPIVIEGKVKLVINRF